MFFWLKLAKSVLGSKLVGRKKRCEMRRRCTPRLNNVDLLAGTGSQDECSGYVHIRALYVRCMSPEIKYSFDRSLCKKFRGQLSERKERVARGGTDLPQDWTMSICWPDDSVNATDSHYVSRTELSRRRQQWSDQNFCSIQNANCFYKMRHFLFVVEPHDKDVILLAEQHWVVASNNEAIQMSQPLDLRIQLRKGRAARKNNFVDTAATTWTL
jgi:hypothetical protein